jgi:hypothetical protein
LDFTWARRVSLRLGGSSGKTAFFALPNAFAVVLLEKNAAWCDTFGDYSTALEYGPPHVLRRIRDGEDKPIFPAPTA